jgi:hypothetical protein
MMHAISYSPTTHVQPEYWGSAHFSHLVYIRFLSAGMRFDSFGGSGSRFSKSTLRPGYPSSEAAAAVTTAVKEKKIVRSRHGSCILPIIMNRRTLEYIVKEEKMG